MNIFQRLFGKRKRVEETRKPKTSEVYNSASKRHRKHNDEVYNNYYYGATMPGEPPGQNDHQYRDGGRGGVSGTWDTPSDSDSSSYSGSSDFGGDGDSGGGGD